MAVAVEQIEDLIQRLAGIRREVSELPPDEPRTGFPRRVAELALATADGALRDYFRARFGGEPR
jgi:hypothetical protein